MAKCENCGNEYDKSFEIIVGGKKHTFDSFECAIHKLHPNARFADVEYLGIASSRKARYSAVLIVLASMGNRIKRPRLSRCSRHCYL